MSYNDIGWAETPRPVTALTELLDRCSYASAMLYDADGPKALTGGGGGAVSPTKHIAVLEKWLNDSPGAFRVIGTRPRT